MQRTLAQHYLERGAPHKHSRNYEQALFYDREIKKALVPSPPPCILQQWDQPADRFVFDEDVTVPMDSMLESKAVTVPQIYAASRWPSDKVWCEMPGTVDKRLFGFLATRLPDGRRRVISILEHSLLLGDTGAPYPVCAFILPELPYVCEGTKRPTITVLWDVLEGNAVRWNTCEFAKEAGTVLTDMLFMLSIPRVCEVREVMMRRGHNNRVEHVLPRIEYKAVRLRVGKGSPRYEAQQPGESFEAYKRRLHHVIGHFRTYVKGRDMPRLSWVEPHWRGDAERGVLLKEHHVDRREA